MDFLTYEKFLNKLLLKIKEIGIDVSSFEMDHIAYKTSSEEEYFKLKPEFLEIGKLAKESVVRGRRVGIFALHEPWTYSQYTVIAIELIAPMRGEVVESGWEHVEFVLNESYESFMKRYPDFDWDTSVMKAASFSMIKLKLDDSMQIKFHQKDILKTVAEEKY